KHRIEKREGIADQYPTGSAHACRVIRIIAGDAHLADQLRALHTLPQSRALLQRVEQIFHRATLALLEVLRPADRSNAHHALGQRNHPHPAMLEAIDADVAGILAQARRGAAKVPENGGALMLTILAPQL